MNSYLRSDVCGRFGGFKLALRVRHLLYLGKPQDRSGSPPTLMPTAGLLTNGPIGVVFPPTIKLITGNC
ncbi:hypothetical protein [Scytonema sp. HK-05]|uniref:hypothetical protein n=1 Tax=Scytonema sp. HK-05 TaxID=1137095 RepID=UPI0011613BFC|nr:hypothetical protein [Scytonema sp. HK-05]